MLTVREADATFVREVQCDVGRLEYFHAKHIGLLFCPEGNCVDCSGTVNLFERIDPKVKIIGVLSGKELDCCYFRISNHPTGFGWGACINKRGFTPDVPGCRERAQAAYREICTLVNEAV